MQTHDPFLPQTLQGWLAAVAIIGAWVAVAWKGWTRMTDKMNGLGGRVKALEDLEQRNAGSVERIEREIAEYRKDREETAERLGRVEKGIDSMSEHMIEMKLELTSHMGEIKHLITEKDAKLRERIVRIETINDVERKTGRKPGET